MTTKRIITYPPKNVVYKNASTTPATTNNNNEPPAWLRVRNHLRGEGWHYGNSVLPTSSSSSSSSSTNLKSASVSGSSAVPSWLGCAMYGTQTIAPESPSKEEIERSLPYKYSEPDAAKNEHVRSQIRSAAKQMNIPTPKPRWLNDFLLELAR